MAAADNMISAKYVDELAIHSLLERYATAITRRDFDAFAACFTPDGVFQEGAPFHLDLRGSETIAARVCALVQDYEMLIQFIQAVAMKVEDSWAYGHCTVFEIGLKGESGEGFMAITLCKDEFIKRDGSWRIARRFTNPVFVTEHIPRGRLFPSTFSR